MIDIERTKDWFATELRYNMEDEKMRPTDLARYCKVTAANMNNYLQGTSFPNPWVLVNMANLFGCTTNDLLDFDEAEDEMLVGYEPDDMFEDEEEFTMHVRNRLELCMLENRMNVNDLSEITGFNPYTIKKWLGKLRTPPTLIRTSDLLKVCDALGCTPSDLLGY